MATIINKQYLIKLDNIQMLAFPWKKIIWQQTQKEKEYHLIVYLFL